MRTRDRLASFSKISTVRRRHRTARALVLAALVWAAFAGTAQASALVTGPSQPTTVATGTGSLGDAGVLLAALLSSTQAGQGMEVGVDRPGGDYHSFPLDWADPSLCQSACTDDASCQAWTYAKPGIVAAQAFCFLKSSVPAAQPNDCCTSGVSALEPTAQPGMEPGTDRPGGDYHNFSLDSPDPSLCQEACTEDTACRAWTYAKPGVVGPEATCFLKSSVPAAYPNDCCTSGVAGMEPGMDRPGGDYHSFPLGWADPSLCQSACIDDASCRAWTYAEPNVVHPQAFCFLKSSVPAAQPNDRCTSGLVPSEGPIVRYAFDADVEADASGNGNRPLWTLGTSFISLDPDGVDGSALAVSPGHAYPVVPAGIVSQLEDFTISSFVKLDKVEAWSRIFDFTTGPSSYMYLTPMNHQGVVSFGINGGSGEQTVSGTQPLLGGVNGYNAQVVMWQHGAFVQLSDTTWVENRHAGSFSYQEIHRDAESVHLYDASRNVGIQLNLFSNEILFWDSHNPSYTFLTTITAANPDEINGYAASRIYHSTGAFLQRTPSTWVGDRGERSFIFTEVRRDEQSVHLRDSTGGVAIELNLRTKTIHYERQSVFGGSFDEENQFRFQDSENPFAAAGWYPMTRTGPEWRNNQWTHVAVTKQGNVAKLYVNGALVGANDNMTLRPADLGVSYGRIGTSPSRNAPELIGSIDDFRIYDRALGAKELQRTTGPDPELITFMGTQTSMTPDELKWDLEKIGYKLVSKDELGENECTILYAKADREEMAAKAGVLMCNTKLANGDVELSSQAVYGGCDGARLDQGVGSTCEVGVAKSELKIKVADGLYNHIEAKGLSAEQCSALSTENTCFGASATVASASYSWKSKNGTGLGVGASIGVGGGAKTRVEDGVLKGEFDVKLGIGFQVQYSVSGKDVLEVYRLGETAWLENEGEIVAVGDKTVQAFESLGNEVHDVGGQAIGVLELGGKNVLVVTNDVGQSVEETYETVETAIGSAAEDVSNGIVDTAGKVANGASTATDETVTFVGEGVSYLGGLF